jgi:hypothetical protein
MRDQPMSDRAIVAVYLGVDVNGTDVMSQDRGMRGRGSSRRPLAPRAESEAGQGGGDEHGHRLAEVEERREVGAIIG